MSNQPHRPSGSPAGTGGEFASQPRDRVDIDLGGATPDPTNPCNWQVGDKVVLLTPNPAMRVETVENATIVAVGKRDVLLSTGERISKMTSQRRREGCSQCTLLRRPDDPEVVAARQSNRVADLMWGVDIKTGAFRKAPTAENAEAAIAAFQEWVEVSKS